MSDERVQSGSVLKNHCYAFFSFNIHVALE